MKIILCGSDGRMGRAVTALAQSGADDLQIVAVTRARPLAAIEEKADALIDFSHPSAIGDILPFLLAKRMPAVLAVTGYTDEEEAQIAAVAERVPVLHTPNLAAGMAVTERLAVMAAVGMPRADIAIVEQHRRGKADTPSGTARRLASLLAAYRSHDPIGVHALRIGEAAGRHTVWLDDGLESIRITHEVHCRQAFAEGALAGARWLCRQPAGLYTRYGGNDHA